MVDSSWGRSNLANQVINQIARAISGDESAMQTRRKNNNTSNAMYGVSRMDSDRFYTHGWRVKLVRRGVVYVKNFPDKRWGGKRKALVQAKAYRDALLSELPEPLTRREFCTALRSNNRSGISGVYRYAKKYTLTNGKVIASWYWEATWPIGRSQQGHQAFSVNEFGERKAKALAIAAREEALDDLDGYYWASQRGAPSQSG